MIIYVDIDETICTLGEYSGTKATRDYNYAKPRYEQIAKINKLYDEGHEIVYWTARGSNTGIDWFGFTIGQLNNWKCKHHKLICGKDKGAFDMVIDDKAKRIEEI